MDGTEIHNALQTEINCLTVVLRKNAILDDFTLKCMSNFQSEDPVRKFRPQSRLEYATFSLEYLKKLSNIETKSKRKTKHFVLKN